MNNADFLEALTKRVVKVFDNDILFIKTFTALPSDYQLDKFHMGGHYCRAEISESGLKPTEHHFVTYDILEWLEALEEK